jgi:hypothetical protein
MDCIVKICADVCCVITALFNIQPGNPVLWLNQVCIKIICTKPFFHNLEMQQDKRAVLILFEKS